MERSRLRFDFLFACIAVAAIGSAGEWPQFHGPGGSGVRAEDDAGPGLPEKIGPEDNLIWRMAVAPGHSSPVVFGGKIFLTAVEEGKSEGEAGDRDGNASGSQAGEESKDESKERLLTLALDARDGRMLWCDEAPHEKVEEIHQRGSLAQPSPAADADVVVSFFGSSGLSCYDHAGKLLWRKRMGPFNDGYGAGSSPVLCGDQVIINQDHDTNSFLMAMDKRTGEIVWKTDRAEFPRGYSTPVIWETAGGRQIAVAGTVRIAGYDFGTGKELWTVRGLARIANPTPVIGPEGNLYLAIWAPGGDSGEGGDRISPVPFAETIARDDRNGNGALEPDEPGDVAIRSRFTQVDRDKDGQITESEYTSMRSIFEESHNVAMCVRPGGSGDVTGTHVVWRQEKMIPYVPSSIVYRGHVFMARNGGVVSSLEAATGRAVKQARVAAHGDYFSSPVAGDGKIYLLSEAGDVTVISAEGQWRELHAATFDEMCYATPAIVGGRIYVRTAAAVYCFGAEGKGNGGE